MNYKIRYDERLIAKAGYPMIGIALAGVMIGSFVSVYIAILFLFLFIFSLNFFRNPKREIPQGADIIVSPADGKVIAIEDIFDKRYLNRPCRRVSIFMSPLNVHINRMPYDGRVERVIYSPGKKFAAFAEKASLENEQNAIEIACPSGQSIVCVQIAGFLARRIVCDARQGDAFKKGERYGLIRFGSRADVYLPVHCAVDVKLGDVVKGGSSILARF